tara:strand:- start:477 stop:689 length:213 start_codon:yes stop_codon:yes gene_type:complete
VALLLGMVIEKEKKKETNMEWLKARCKEVSSLHGGALIAMGLVILFASPIAKMAAWASIAWGLWAIWKKD